MKLLEAIEIKGRPFEIPDCSRDDLPQFFVDLGFKRGVEIGVMHGNLSELFAKAGLEHYAIDPWLTYEDFPNQGGQAREDKIYEHARKLLGQYPNCKIIRKTSMQALSKFKDGSLDYVYIDGNHHLKYITEDLCCWAKKLRPGGIMSGHDYVYFGATHPMNICHVPYAIKAYVHSYNVENFWVLGSKNPKEGEVRDKWRSWMWFHK